MTENLQRVGFLASIPPLLREFGCDPGRVLASVGLAASALDDPEAVVAYPTMGRLIQACADQTGCQHFGLLMGQRAGTLSLGVIGELMSHAPTLGAAMRDLVVHQHRHARGSVVYLLDMRDSVLFGYTIYQADMRGAAQVYDGAVAMAFGIIRTAVGPQGAEALEVLLSRAEPVEVGPYRRYFGVKVQFNSEFSGVLVPRGWTDRAVLAADPVRRQELERSVESYWQAGDYDFVAMLRRKLSAGLLTGQIGGDEIAGQFGIARRTLHRRLLGNGAKFQRILDETRFEVAKQLLENSELTAGQIGLVLRYADQSAFTRAFERWSDRTPGEWRNRTRRMADVPAG